MYSYQCIGLCRHRHGARRHEQDESAAGVRCGGRGKVPGDRAVLDGGLAVTVGTLPILTHAELGRIVSRAALTQSRAWRKGCAISSCLREARRSDRTTKNPDAQLAAGVRFLRHRPAVPDHTACFSRLSLSRRLMASRRASTRELSYIIVPAGIISEASRTALLTRRKAGPATIARNGNTGTRDILVLPHTAYQKGSCDGDN